MRVTKCLMLWNKDNHRSSCKNSLPLQGIPDLSPYIQSCLWWYHCPSAKEAALNHMGKQLTTIHSQLITLPIQSKAQHNKTIYIFYGISLPWRGHDMEILSALPALCEGNPLVNSTHRGSMTYSSIISFKSVWTSCWNNSPVASDLRCTDSHVMSL